MEGRSRPKIAQGVRIAQDLKGGFNEAENPHCDVDPDDVDPRHSLEFLCQYEKHAGPN